MNKLMNKLIMNQIDMRISPWGIIFPSVQVTFTKDIYQKSIILDDCELNECYELGTENILLIELDKFIEQIGDPSIFEEKE